MPAVSENYCCAYKKISGDLVQDGGDPGGPNPGGFTYERLRVGVDCVCKALIGFGTAERLERLGLTDIPDVQPAESESVRTLKWEGEGGDKLIDAKKWWIPRGYY